MLVALITVAGTLCGVALGARLHKKFSVSAEREGRVWDRQCVGYQVVIQKLDQVRESADRIDEGYANSPPERETPHLLGSLPSDETVWAECQSEFARHQFVFSDTFVAAFRALQYSLEQIGSIEIYGSGAVAREAKTFREAYSKLECIALKDLGLNPDRTLR